MTGDSPRTPDGAGSGDPQAFIAEAERFSGRTFRYRAEMTALLELSRARGQQQLFDDLVFHAKFVTNALQILKRVGADNADAVQLGAELNSMLEKTMTLLRTIIKESPGEFRQHILDDFLSLSQTSMTNLTALLAELAWVKNFMLDTRRAR
jgi:hypothetical protein